MMTDRSRLSSQQRTIQWRLSESSRYLADLGLTREEEEATIRDRVSRGRDIAPVRVQLLLDTIDELRAQMKGQLLMTMRLTDDWEVIDPPLKATMAYDFPSIMGVPGLPKGTPGTIVARMKTKVRYIFVTDDPHLSNPISGNSHPFDGDWLEIEGVDRKHHVKKPEEKVEWVLQRRDQNGNVTEMMRFNEQEVAAFYGGQYAAKGYEVVPDGEEVTLN